MAELYLIEFKGSRREYFFNTYYHALKLSDYVIIQAEQGEDMGLVTRKISPDIDFSRSGRPRSILRPAGDQDRSHFLELRRRDVAYQVEFARLVKKHGLSMKVVDVECQFDGSKITFFFTAEQRVDFRALVRDLAARYKTRIELRQIGVRDEAQRIGGYGICGREQCCSGHIKSFAPISTQHARDQDLSLNPSKISGNCGRLLCCLRYEADQYADTKKKFPAEGSVVRTKQGSGTIERIDIFTEEAVVINDENIRFRAASDDIIKVEKSGRPGGERRATIADNDEIADLEESAMDEDDVDTESAED